MTEFRALVAEFFSGVEFGIFWVCGTDAPNPDRVSWHLGPGNRDHCRSGRGCPIASKTRGNFLFGFPISHKIEVLLIISI